MRYKLVNTDRQPQVDHDGSKDLYKWELKNLKAYKLEKHSGSAFSYEPVVLVAPNKFQLDEYEGDMTSWIAEPMSQGDDELITRKLALAIHLAPGNAPDVADCVCTVLERAELREAFHLDVDRDRIERCLEACATRGNAQAALMLGRALCGISVGPLRADKLVSAPNMRKGAALLLRAADAGKDQAWLLLYGVHSNHRASVANPQMARFFLEKAATRGDTLAQRRLGALVLRSATTLHESEQGIHWLHEAMEKGDASALRLLQTARATRTAGA